MSGESGAGERTVIITPTFELNKVKKGDILCIPWGIRPNTYLYPTIPDGQSPAMAINSPTGVRYLPWDGVSGYQGNNLLINFDGTTWAMSGEVTHQFTTANFTSEPFPAGYSFLKKTGLLAEFKIIKFDAELDHLGNLAFYKMFVEAEEQNGLELQE